MTQQQILRGEEFLFAVLLASIIEACSAMNDNALKSWHRSAYARAFTELATAGFIEIQSKDGDDILAHVTPAGRLLIERLHNDEKASHASLYGK